jgi:hypothetical protein
MHRLGRLRHALAIVALSCVATGCFKATFADVRSPVGERHEVWLDGYLFGLAGSGEVDTRFFCKSGPAKVSVYESAGTWALTVLSLGIFTPRKAAVACASVASPRRDR